MNRNGTEQRKLYRSNSDSVIAGVCGGIAEYFDLPPWGVRLVWVLLTFFGWPFTVIGYVVLAFALKRRPLEYGGGRPDAFAPDWKVGCSSHGEMLGRLQERFSTLDRRLQRMESIVTRPNYGLEEKYRDLR
jgi:phage shock protein C